MEILIHASDISNPIKPYDIYNQWADRVLQEYWTQVIFNNKKKVKYIKILR
jgi:hypothetical protein